VDAPLVAGRPVLWAIVRSEATTVYETLLKGLRSSAEELLLEGQEFKPSWAQLCAHGLQQQRDQCFTCDCTVCMNLCCLCPVITDDY
jgi:hypothetical protein